MTNKTTHTIQDVEGLILDKLAKLRDSNDRKEQKQLRSEILRLEKHFNDCNEKHLNGKKYPIKQKPIPISKKDLLALIDDIETPEDKSCEFTGNCMGLDISGVFVK